MHIPTHFSEQDPSVLQDLIEKHPLGILITHSRNGLDANHIPFGLERKEGTPGILHCHVARANPVWKEITNGDEILVVFRAEDAYISPNWYPSKQEFHKQVPTWNYSVAHVYGRVTIREDEEYVLGAVTRLTQIHEASEVEPWKLTDSPESFIDALLKAIVGIEIEITRLVGKTKLSQNKNESDIRGAAEVLLSRGQKSIGEAMLAQASSRVKRET